MALAVEYNNQNGAPWLTPTKRSVESPCIEQRSRKVATCLKEKVPPTESTRKVNFSKKVRVVEYFVRKSESDDYSSWYTKADYKSFQKDRSRNMHALKFANGDVNAIDKTLYCLRGLEDHVSVSTRQEKTLRKISLVQAVLDEQKRQRMAGVNDDNSLSTVSCIMSEFGRRRSREFGLMDASENNFLAEKISPIRAVPLLSGVSGPPRRIQKCASSA